MTQLNDNGSYRPTERWRSLQGARPLEIIEAMAAALVSQGLTLGALTGGDNEAEITIRGWPAAAEPTAPAGDRGAAPPSAEAAFVWLDEVADYLGVNFRAQREGDEVIIRIYC